MKKLKIGIVTPLYNRSDLITRLYNSIKDNKRSYKYQWLIVDDCSTDDSYKIAKALKNTNDLDIKIVKHQSNKGKNEAMNTAYDNIDQYCNWYVEIDSDDYFIDGFFEKMEEDIIDEEIINNVECISYKDLYEDGKVVGHDNKKSKVSTHYSWNYDLRRTGDRLYVHKNGRKEFRYRDINGKPAHAEYPFWFGFYGNSKKIYYSEHPAIKITYLETGLSNNFWKNLDYKKDSMLEMVKMQNELAKSFKAKRRASLEIIFYSKLFKTGSGWKYKNAKAKILVFILSWLLLIPMMFKVRGIKKNNK